ncbi:MAG: ComEC/Rec2 family competence protein [Candidatus Harrisonbacteria bacterium]|nr:ComEC/Rec2 family competence protein [Candidatus Harrisonbacteria bacterium]
MKLHEIFFWTTCFFLAGVFIASIAIGFEQARFITTVVILLIFSIAFFYRQTLPYGAVFIVLVMFLGAGYYFIFDVMNNPGDVPFGQKVKITGIIVEAEQRLNSQKLVIESAERLQITAGRYPKFDYGDRVQVEGIIEKINPEWQGYFSKEGIAGLVSFPKIELIAKNQGSPIKAALFSVKEYFEESYRKVLPLEKAAFLSGLTLGSTAEFSDEFKENMRLTGTTHLVALSGYNITVITVSLGAILGLWWFTKKWRLLISILFILSFVIMTGAEASVVRAAIMAMILLFADQFKRIYYLRNAIAAAALVMVILNPKVLVFDIGFQLSFAALLGISYFRPYLQKWLKFTEKPGIFNWREHFLTTTSAQVAVLPLALYHFGYFSPMSLITNILVLEFVPITMTLGFFTAFSAAISYHLSWLLSFPTSIFLGYELGVINLFAKIIQFL